MKRILIGILVLCIAMLAVACKDLEKELAEPVVIPAQVDLDLTDELAQIQAVLAQFEIDGNVRSVENPQEVGAPYIPEGAECTQVSILLDSVTIGYMLDGVRYTVDYMKNGVITIAAGIIVDGEVVEYFMTDSTTDKVQRIKK